MKELNVVGVQNICVETNAWKLQIFVNVEMTVLVLTMLMILVAAIKENVLKMMLLVMFIVPME